MALELNGIPNGCTDEFFLDLGLFGLCKSLLVVLDLLSLLLMLLILCLGLLLDVG